MQQLWPEMLEAVVRSQEVMMVPHICLLLADVGVLKLIFAALADEGRHVEIVLLEVSAHVALHLLQRGRLAGRGGCRAQLRSNWSSRGRGQWRGPRGSKCRNRARVGDGGRRRGDLPFALAGVIWSDP